MHDRSLKNPAYQSLTDQQLSEIDDLCDRFDQELVEGCAPRIEVFLADAPEAAQDQSEYLTGETVTARPPSTWSQDQKFARRNRGLVAAVPAIDVFALSLRFSMDTQDDPS